MDLENCKYTDEDDEIFDESAGNTTAADGSYLTPFAFGKKRKKLPTKFTYLEPAISEQYNYESLIHNIERLINEISYVDFKNDEGSNYKQKINLGVQEISTQLYKMEQALRRVHKLKTEIGADQTIFFKSTFNKFTKISERLLRLGNQIRELSK